MSKKDDPLFQNEASNDKARKFADTLTKAIEEYLAFKDEMAKFVLYDKVKIN